MKLVGRELRLSQQWALEPVTVNSIVGWANREGIVLFYSPSSTLCPGEAPGYTGVSLVEGTNMFRGLEHLPWGESLRDLGLCSLEQRLPWGNLTAALNTCMEVTAKMEPSAWPRCMVGGKIKVSMKNWNRLPREIS